MTEDTDATESTQVYKHETTIIKVATGLAHKDLKISRQPKEHLIDIRDCLIEALETDRMEKDKDFNKLVCEDGASLLQLISKTKSNDQEVSLKVLRILCVSIFCSISMLQQAFMVSFSKSSMEN